LTLVPELVIESLDSLLLSWLGDSFAKSNLWVMVGGIH
jgi:hypothetical protein